MEIQFVGTAELEYDPNKINIDNINNSLLTHLDKFDTIDYEKVTDISHLFTIKFIFTTNTIDYCKSIADYNSHIIPLLYEILPSYVLVNAFKIYHTRLIEKKIDHIATPLSNYFESMLKGNK